MLANMMNLRVLIQTQIFFTCQYYFGWSFFIVVVFLCFSVCTVCFQQWQYYPSPQMIWVCLFSFRKLLYLCVLFFFFFLYCYLLHYVVYNTVVCINTIIYFSIKKSFQSQMNWRLVELISEVLKYVFFNKRNYVFFSHWKQIAAPCKPEIGTCDLSASTLMSVLLPFLIWSYWTLKKKN